MAMQSRTLVRAADLAEFRRALVELSLEAPPLAARRRAVIVPTRASAELLRQTIERSALAGGHAALILPDILTRDDWMARLHRSLPGSPRFLSRLEREVLIERAARRTAERTRQQGFPFRLRPGLVSAILDFYDELARRERSVPGFARALFDRLRKGDLTDRGSESLIRQTSFLGFTFIGYRRGVLASGGLDEHEVRRRLVDAQPELPFDHVVVAVADHPSDPRGLWPADFDLLGRLRSVARIDVVTTDETHDAGLRDRLERQLPGIRERAAGRPAAAPIVERPGAEQEDSGESPLCWTSRDREEELRDVARAVRRRAGGPSPEPPSSTAVVFQRPLPYLYLARQVLTEARVPFQTFDALPLGAEPAAATLDLVMTAARTGGTREAAAALLRAPLMRFEIDGAPITGRDVAALDDALAERRAAGEANTYAAEVDACYRSSPGWSPRREDRARVRDRALRAARAAAAVRDELQGFRTSEAGSAQVAVIAAFLRRHQQDPGGQEAWRDRHVRARSAVLAVLDGLVDAFRRHDDRRRSVDELVGSIHHAVENQMFTPRRGRSGVHLVDASAARFGEFAHVHLVGLVESEWPERLRRSIFYTTEYLGALDWPREAEHVRAEQAAFRDLLKLAARTVRLHAFKLEGDAIAAVSSIVDAARELSSTAIDPATERRRVFPDEVLTVAEVSSAGLTAEAAEWLALRKRRPALADRRYRGFVEPRAPLDYRVSKVDQYIVCPFKYFAESVLGLPEEREELAGLTPLERGALVHRLFERFYREWQGAGLGAITPANMPEAVDRFARLTRQELAPLPDADRALEETRLLGSIVASGVAERVFELEAEKGGAIVDRLLEYELRGPFKFPYLHGLSDREISIYARADRIDVFGDGTVRVIDYKLGRLPNESSVQLGVYAHCAAQLLEARDGRPRPVKDAWYLAFGDDRNLKGDVAKKGEMVGLAVGRQASAFAGTVGRIEAGEFPATPVKTSFCGFCRYAGVCRKEYWIESDEAAVSV
jgi:RecB family exonuclease